MTHSAANVSSAVLVLSCSSFCRTVAQQQALLQCASSVFGGFFWGGGKEFKLGQISWLTKEPLEYNEKCRYVLLDKALKPTSISIKTFLMLTVQTCAITFFWLSLQNNAKSTLLWMEYKSYNTASQMSVALLQHILNPRCHRSLLLQLLWWWRAPGSTLEQSDSQSAQPAHVCAEKPRQNNRIDCTVGTR